MDGDENISGCNEFGLPVNDVILASHARSNSGSADINNFDFCHSLVADQRPLVNRLS